MIGNSQDSGLKNINIRLNKTETICTDVDGRVAAMNLVINQLIDRINKLETTVSTHETTLTDIINS